MEYKGISATEKESTSKNHLRLNLMDSVKVSTDASDVLNGRARGEIKHG